MLEIRSTADDGVPSNIFLTLFSGKKIMSISDQEIPPSVRAKFSHVNFEKEKHLILDILPTVLTLSFQMRRSNMSATEEI